MNRPLILRQKDGMLDRWKELKSVLRLQIYRELEMTRGIWTLCFVLTTHTTQNQSL